MKNNRNQSKVLVITAVFCLLAGCGSSDSPSPAAVATVTQKAALVGTLDGDLSDNVPLQFDLSVSTGDPSLPLIIGEAIWNDALVALVKKRFDDGRPIALVYADAGEINALRRIVGLPETSALPVGFSYADCYALDRDKAGNLYELVVLPGQKEIKTTEQSYTLDTTNEQATLSGTKDAIDTYLSTELEQQQQAALLATWLGNDADRDTALTADATATAAKQALKKASDTTIGGYNIDEIAKSTEITYTFQLGKNRYQVTNNVWSVYDQANKQSYFYVRQKGMFAASQEYWIDFYWHKANFASRYILTNFVTDFLNDNVNVQTVANAPKTHEGKKSVDDGIDYKLGGKLGLDIKDDLSFKGELSGDIGIKHSIKYDISDVTVTNKSGVHLNDATWDFAILWPNYTWNPICGLVAFGPTPEVGKGTFQPSTEWIWRVKDKVKEKHPQGLPIRTDFYAETGARLLPGGYSLCVSIDTIRKTENLYGTMTVLWPTTTVNVNR